MANMGCHLSRVPTETKERRMKLEKNIFINAGVLGEGGFGKVIASMCSVNKTWYALKEIKKSELIQHKTGMNMIFSELQAMKRLSHPFIIDLHFAFHDKKCCYLVIDLQTGGDLRYYLRKRFLFEERDVALIVSCLSSALEHIHSKNIIHRDVKPENILLDERGYPYLTDFGVAHVQTEAWDSTLTCNLASGTKQYLAPEVFVKGHVHGPEVDFWSLGVVSYELLFGKRPFEKHCPVQLINYLEKAFVNKRKHLKELKMKELNGSPRQSLDLEFSSPNYSPNHSFDLTAASLRSATAQREPQKERKSLDNSRSSNTCDSTTFDRFSSIGSTGLLLSTTDSERSTKSPDRNLIKQNDISSVDKEIKFPDLSFPHHPHKTLALFNFNNSSLSCQKNSDPKNNSLYIGNDYYIDIIEESETEEEKDSGYSLTTGSDDTKRALPGDHWLVDEGNLPSSLIVSVPNINPWLGTLSKECVELLQGLFEVRPSHRLGCRNFDKLRSLRWFKKFNLQNWDALASKDYQPFFQPGRRFIKEALRKFEQQEAMILGTPEFENIYPEKGSDENLSNDQEIQFQEFRFISSRHLETFIY